MNTKIESDVTDSEPGIETLAHQLGVAITDLPEYEAFEAARDNVATNEEVQEAIEEFEESRREFLMARQVGEATQADLQELQSMQEDLNSIPVMAEYLEQKESLDDRLSTINEAISEPLSINFSDETGGCCQD